MIKIKEMTLSAKDSFNIFFNRYKVECGDEKLSYSLNPNNLEYKELYWIT